MMMKMNAFLRRAVFFLLFIPFKTSAQERTDVCIYGSSSAGVVAAYSLAQLGRTVIILDPGAHIGGLSSGGLGYTDIGNKYAITGISRDFYRQIGAHYGKFEQWIFEPHVAEELFRKMLRSEKITLLSESRLMDVKKEGKRIQSIRFSRKGKAHTVQAKIFMDCSYEGDLMAMAGVSYTVGREPGSLYGERYNGVQLMKGHQFPDGIDPYKKKGHPSSGLLWGISAARLQPDGTGDSLVQAYNYRICLSNVPENRIPITRPAGYDPARYDLLVRLMGAQPQKLSLNDYFIWSRMPNGKTDINNRNGFSTDMIGENHHYPEASFEERKKYIELLTSYTKGLLYFFSHDPRVPDTLRKQMREWGYPKDEYVRYGNWSPQPYIRESRRMVGAYVMTQANCTGKTTVPDPVGLAAYTMDSHNTQRIVWNGMVKNEGNVEVGGFPPYPIAYRSLLPRPEECTNLMVPVCLSASHIAYGSIRMEPVFMVLAQSCAVAAHFALERNKGLHEIPVTDIRYFLERDPLLDGSTPEILVDNDFGRIKKKGEWKKEAGNGYGMSLLKSITKPDNPEQYIRFFPEIKTEGRYQLYIYHTPQKEKKSSAAITVFSGKKRIPVLLEEAEVPVLGQTSGEWIGIGTFEFFKNKKAYVEIKSVPGITSVADAVLFVPIKPSSGK